MSHRGRVLVVEEKPRPETHRLWDGVRAEGWQVEVGPLAQTLDRARDGDPDLIVLDFAGTGSDALRARYREAAARLTHRRGSDRRPVVALDEERTGDLRPLGVTDVLRAPWSVGHVVARIGSLTRLATMRREIRRRIDTAHRWGLDVPEPDLTGSAPDAHVLVVGAGIRYFTIERALAKGATLVGAFTIDTALDYLDRRPFDAIVLNLPLEDAAEFIEILRRNPDHFARPAVVLTGEADPRSIEAVFAAGADDVVFAGESEACLSGRVEAAMNEHHLRETLRSAYGTTHGAVTNDALTGLYGRGFLMDHLARQIEDARETGERLTLVGLRLLDLAQFNAEWGWSGGDRLLRQIGSLIARVVRGEDLAARAGGDRFALALPATDADDALRVAHRIAGMIETTAFSVPEATGPIYATLAVGAAEMEPHDDADTLYARAFV